MCDRSAAGDSRAMAGKSRMLCVTRIRRSAAALATLSQRTVNALPGSGPPAPPSDTPSDRHLAHAHQWRALQRPRQRLLHPPEPRPHHQTPHPTARSPQQPLGHRVTITHLQRSPPDEDFRHSRCAGRHASSHGELLSPRRARAGARRLRPCARCLVPTQCLLFRCSRGASAPRPSGKRGSAARRAAGKRAGCTNRTIRQPVRRQDLVVDRTSATPAKLGSGPIGTGD